MRDIERTFIAIKPDGVKLNLIGEIIRRIEQKRFRIRAMKMTRPSRELVEEHYEEHRGTDRFDPLCDFMCSGDVVAMVVEGEGVIRLFRTMLGPFDPGLGKPGEIRFDLGGTIEESIGHGSDSPKAAEREIDLWFPELEPAA